MIHEIFIYDEVGEWGIDDRAVVDQLSGVPRGGEILLRINSPGGDAYTGLSIYNYLRSRPEHITAQVDGMAASAASSRARSMDGEWKSKP